MPTPIVLNPDNTALAADKRPGFLKFGFLLLLIGGVAGLLWLVVAVILLDAQLTYRLITSGVSTQANVIREGHELVTHGGRHSYTTNDLYWEVEFTDAQGKVHGHKIFPGSEDYAGQKTTGVKYLAENPESWKLDIQINDNPWGALVLLALFMVGLAVLISWCTWKIYEQFMQNRYGLLIEGVAVTLNQSQNRKGYQHYYGTCSFRSPEGREVQESFSVSTMSKQYNPEAVSGVAIWIVYWKDNSYRVL